MKKAKRRFTDKLTLKQARIISVLLWICLVIPVVMIAYKDKEIVIEKTGFSWSIIVLFYIVGSTLFSAGFYEVILDGTGKEPDQAHTRLQADIICEFPSSTDGFTEIFLKSSSIGDKEKMFLEILKNENCRFWAKLNEEKNIVVMAKDKNDDIVYEQIIENYSYFNSVFKVSK